MHTRAHTQAFTPSAQQVQAQSASLAHHLQTWPDQQLVLLLHQHPDLVDPVPSSLRWLAHTALSSRRITHALHQLNLPALQMVTALALLPQPTTWHQLGTALGSDAATPAPSGPAETNPRATQVHNTLKVLQDSLLVWGDASALHLAHHARLSATTTHLAGPTAAQLLEHLPTADLTQLIRNLTLPLPDNRSAQLRLLQRHYDNTRAVQASLTSLTPPAVHLLRQMCHDPAGNHTSAEEKLATLPQREQASTPWQLLHALGLLLPNLIPDFTPSSPSNSDTDSDPGSDTDSDMCLQVRLVLTQGVVFPDWPPLPRPAETSPLSNQLTPTRVDQAGCAHGDQLVRQVDQLVTVVSGTESASITGVRSGGLGSKQLRRLSALVAHLWPNSSGAPLEDQVALCLEILVQAGLFTSIPGGGTSPPRWQESTWLHQWHQLPLSQQWAHLAWAWLHLRREPGQDGPAAALGPNSVSGQEAMRYRRDVFACLLGQPGALSQDDNNQQGDQGGRFAFSTAVAPLPDAHQVAHMLHWHWPMCYPNVVSTRLTRLLDQAQQAGILTGTHPTSFGTVLILAAFDPPPQPHPTQDPLQGGKTHQTDTGTPGPLLTNQPVLAQLAQHHQHHNTSRQEQALTRAAQLIEPLLPPLTDTVIIQADLTAMTTGRLASPTAAQLGQLAQVESTGGVTMYRFSAEKISQALRHGTTAHHIHQFLAHISRTQLPQPLTYLINDLDRLHTRDGHHHATDDGATGEAKNDNHPAPPHVEQPTKAPLQRPYRSNEPGPTVGIPALTQLVAAWRATDELSAPVSPSGSSLPENTPTPSHHLERLGHPLEKAPPLHTLPPGPLLQLLHRCAHSGRKVWVGYVNVNAVASTGLLQPVKVQGGAVHAFEQTSQGLIHRRLALHRITGVAEPEDSDTLAHSPERP